MGETVQTTLTQLDKFRHVCESLAAVGKSMALQVHKDQLVMYTVDPRLSFQLWVTLMAGFVTSDRQINVKEGEGALEMSADNMNRAFRAHSAGDVVELRVKTRANDARMLTLSFESHTIEGIIKSKVHQRVPARLMQAHDLVEEPDFPGIELWGVLGVLQVGKMQRVCEQYAILSPRVCVTLSQSGELTLSTQSSEAEVTSSWSVQLTDVVGTESQPQQTSLALPEIEQEQTTDVPHIQGNYSCVVRVRDWLTVLRARQTVERFIVGVANDIGVAVHGFFREESQNNAMSFYLIAHSY